MAKQRHQQILLWMLLASLLVILIAVPARRRVYTTSSIRISRLSSATNDFSDQVLRKVDKWACVKNCGACCKLGKTYWHLL